MPLIKRYKIYEARLVIQLIDAIAIHILQQQHASSAPIPSIANATRLDSWDEEKEEEAADPQYRPYATKKSD